MPSTSHISPEQSQAMQERFEQLIRSKLPNQTVSVTFNLPMVLEYLQQMSLTAQANEVKISLGRYAPQSTDSARTSEEAGGTEEDGGILDGGRITVIIEAVKDGQGVSQPGDESTYPVNGGSLLP